MMQEYDDDFFFEEDKMKGNAETNGGESKSLQLWDPRERELQERKHAALAFAELRKVRIEAKKKKYVMSCRMGVYCGFSCWSPFKSKSGGTSFDALSRYGELKHPLPDLNNLPELMPYPRDATIPPRAILMSEKHLSGCVLRDSMPYLPTSRQLAICAPYEKKKPSKEDEKPSERCIDGRSFKVLLLNGEVKRYLPDLQNPPLIAICAPSEGADCASVPLQESTKEEPDSSVPEEKAADENGENGELVESPDCIFNDLRRERYMIYHQDLMGMTVTSGSVVLSKDEKNLIGISIGGGAPLCPCLYIVQIFDNTPASKEGTLQSGDELVGVNGQSVKGKTKVEVAKMIQTAKDEVTINYNKLHADPKQGVSLDIIMKKMKHRLVENMSSGAADALVSLVSVKFSEFGLVMVEPPNHIILKSGDQLKSKWISAMLRHDVTTFSGLSRAILCNDTLVAKLDELKDTETVYRKLVDHAKRMLKSYFDLLQTYKAVGDVFASIGVREPQARASEAFTKFGQYHRLLEKDGIKMLKALKPILADLGTYLNKAIPDTKLTIRKYADTKFEYLSYCLKVKEMDDEEYGYNTLQEPLYRVETGNYEYRLILRCRQDARARFARLRSDVLVKLELLENKKTQDVSFQLRRFIAGFAAYHDITLNHLKQHASLFPIEVDLSQNAFQYKSTAQVIQDNAEDEDEIELAKELKEYHDMVENEISNEDKQRKADNRRPAKDMANTESAEQLLPDFDAVDASAKTDKTGNAGFENTGNYDKNDTDRFSLLTELGLADMGEFGEFQNGMMDDLVPFNTEPKLAVDDVFERLLNDL